MRTEPSNVFNKDFSKFSKKIDKKLIILVLAFFLVVFVIFYYRNETIKELESLLPAPTQVIKNTEEKINRMSIPDSREGIVKVSGDIREVRKDSFVVGKESDLLLVTVPSSGTTILKQEKRPDGITTNIKLRSQLDDVTGDFAGGETILILDKKAEGYPETLIVKEIHIIAED